MNSRRRVNSAEEGEASETKRSTDKMTSPRIKVLLLLLLLLIASCRNSLAPKYTEPVILQVFDRDGGMVCSTEEHVQLRVYANGLAEGDILTGPCGPWWSKVFSSFSRRTVQLSYDQFDQLKTALKQSELLTLHETYPQFVIGVDSGVFETIKFEVGGQQKSVALVNPDPTHPQNKANYPASLINLLVEIERARQRVETDGK